MSVQGQRLPFADVQVGGDGEQAHRLADCTGESSGDPADRLADVPAKTLGRTGMGTMSL